VYTIRLSLLSGVHLGYLGVHYVMEIGIKELRKNLKKFLSEETIVALFPFDAKP
jgi:hypothetical protein